MCFNFELVYQKINESLPQVPICSQIPIKLYFDEAQDAPHLIQTSLKNLCQKLFKLRQLKPLLKTFQLKIFVVLKIILLLNTMELSKTFELLNILVQTIFFATKIIMESLPQTFVMKSLTLDKFANNPHFYEHQFLDTKTKNWDQNKFHCKIQFCSLLFSCYLITIVMHFILCLVQTKCFKP